MSDDLDVKTLGPNDAIVRREGAGWVERVRFTAKRTDAQLARDAVAVVSKMWARLQEKPLELYTVDVRTATGWFGPFKVRSKSAAPVIKVDEPGYLARWESPTRTAELDAAVGAIAEARRSR